MERPLGCKVDAMRHCEASVWTWFSALARQAKIHVERLEAVAEGWPDVWWQDEEGPLSGWVELKALDARLPDPERMIKSQPVTWPKIHFRPAQPPAFVRRAIAGARITVIAKDPQGSALFLPVMPTLQWASAAAHDQDSMPGFLLPPGWDLPVSAFRRLLMGPRDNSRGLMSILTGEISVSPWWGQLDDAKNRVHWRRVLVSGGDLAPPIVSDKDLVWR